MQKKLSKQELLENKLRKIIRTELKKADLKESNSLILLRKFAATPEGKKFEESLRELYSNLLKVKGTNPMAAGEAIRSYIDSRLRILQSTEE